jgi:hypothetical protein
MNERSVAKVDTVSVDPTSQVWPDLQELRQRNRLLEKENEVLPPSPLT